MTPQWNRVSGWAAGLIDYQAPADSAPPSRLWAFYRWCLAGAGRAIAIAVVANASVGVIEVTMMIALGAVIDAAVAGPVSGFVAQHWALLLGGAALILVLRPLAFGFAGLTQSVTVQPNLFNLILSRLHRHTLGQSVSFFDNDFAGRITQKQMQTANSMTESVNESINVGSFAISSVLAIGAFVAGLSPVLLLVLVGWMLLYAGFLRFFLPRLRELAAKRASARAMVTGQVVDTVTNIKTVKLFALDDHEDRAALGAMGFLRDRSLDHGRLAVLFRAGLIALAGLLPVGLVGTGLWAWAGGVVTPGELTAIGAMGLRLSQMTGWVSWTLMMIYAHIGEVEDGMQTLSPAHGLIDKPGALSPTQIDPTVRFRDVTFAYGGETGGVQDIDLTVPAGQKLGLVGASGAGKSTLVSLLLRLFDTEEGAVIVGGHDVRDLSQEALRKQIGMVTQETAMFNRSARDNILYGRPDASEDEMIDAARRAEAHEFILTLRDHKGRTGYDAHLGERGVKLSGGQRQRIALARALLKDAPILVLDEATSALDSEVEAQIQQALEAAMEGKTVIAIAHRLSTLADMDRIIVLDQGRIAEDGTPDALLAQGGLYARFWERQSGGFIGAD
ncbi:MAG: multidrug ABC transporter ATP-binding protein [Rhodobacterales bacterium]|nr:MAG: multidrug ABC transporter ATP-binding protein [Rhodobacterales bacterium]